MKDILLYKHQLKKLQVGELSHENMISSHVKIIIVIFICEKITFDMAT